MGKENPHAEHRIRLRDQFLNHGLESLPDHKTLELLLFYAIPQRDVSEEARALLHRFGSFSAVLEAAPQDLMEIKGIGKISASLIQLITALGRRYQIEKQIVKSPLLSTEEIGRHILPYFYGCTEEVVYLFCLNANRVVTYHELLAEGSVNSVNFNVRRATEVSLRRGATSVILAHNHPGGVAMPSTADIRITEKFVAALAAVGLCLVDHIIVANDDFVSLRDSGHLAQIESMPNSP